MNHEEVQPDQEAVDSSFLVRCLTRLRQMDRAAAELTEALGLPHEAQYEIFTMLYGGTPRGNNLDSAEADVRQGE